MTIYHLIAYSLSIFLISVIILACSYNAKQSELIDDGSDEAYDKLNTSHSRFQKAVATVGTLAWLFTIVHATIAAATLLAGWL